jgi:hypothetical protein
MENQMHLELLMILPLPQAKSLQQIYWKRSGLRKSKPNLRKSKTVYRDFIDPFMNFI